MAVGITLRSLAQLLAVAHAIEYVPQALLLVRSEEGGIDAGLLETHEDFTPRFVAGILLVLHVIPAIGQFGIGALGFLDFEIFSQQVLLLDGRQVVEIVEKGYVGVVVGEELRGDVAVVHQAA